MPYKFASIVKSWSFAKMKRGVFQSVLLAPQDSLGWSVYAIKCNKFMLFLKVFSKSWKVLKICVYRLTFYTHFLGGSKYCQHACLPFDQIIKQLYLPKDSSTVNSRLIHTNFYQNTLQALIFILLIFHFSGEILSPTVFQYKALIQNFKTELKIADR